MGAVQNTKSGKLIFQNAKGELVRVYDGATAESGRPSTAKLTLIYRHDTRRVEPILSSHAIDELKKSGVEYDVLGETTPAEIAKKPFAVGQSGHFAWVATDSSVLSPSHSLKEDEDEQKKFILIGRWVGGVQAALIALTLILGHFLKTEDKKEEDVTVIHAVKLEQLVAKEKPVVVPPAKHIVKPQPIPRKVVAHIKPPKKQPTRPQPVIVTKRAPKVPTRQIVTARIPKTQQIENLGALGALGGVGKKMQSGGGLNINGASLARGGERGSGGGGVGGPGSGGVSNALFGKGLIAASNGSGARAGSVGGYGTKGKGGGRQGYGDRVMLGSSGGFAAPLDTESFVEGGLSREQVEEVILRNMGQITYCYEKGLQVEPSLRGRVAVSFVIGAGGQVTTARVQHTSVDSRQLEGCIVGRLKQFQFPRPVAGVNVQVQYPFSFRRVSSNN